MRKRRQPRSLGFVLDARADEALYRQVFDQVVERIRAGTLPPGFRLPPTRELASELGTHRNTVVRAYEELEAAGFVSSTVGRGTFVASAVRTAEASEPPKRAPLAWDSLVSRVTGSEPLGRLDRLMARPPGREVVNLTRQQPAADLLPEELLRRCLDHALRTLGARALEYAPRDGLPRLRALIAADLAAQGVPASADDVVITSGSQQGLDLVARALLDPGDPFLVDSLTYSGAVNLLSAAGARLIGIPSDDDGPDLEALERAARGGAKGLYLMPNGSNPTGQVISRERREALVDWSHRAGVPLIEDDYTAGLHLDGVPPAAMRALSGEVVYLGSYSKKLIPALRIGFVVAPPALRTRLVALKHSMDLGTSLLLQHTLAEFLERGYLAAHLSRTLPEYRARRDALLQALHRHLPEVARPRRPRHGLTMWIDLPGWIDSDAVYEEARRRGVLVSPGTLFGVGVTRAAGLRLVFSTESRERLLLGGRRLGQALHALAADRPRAASSPALDLT